MDLDQARRLQERLDKFVEVNTSSTPQVIELLKLRIAFWDKLVILNAGGLALSLTAAAFFRNHTHGDGGFGFLLAAWKLLIASVVCSVCAQWLASSSATYLTRNARAIGNHHAVTMLAALNPLLAVEVKTAVETDLRKIAGERDESSRLHRISERLSYFTGAAAALCTALLQKL